MGLLEQQNDSLLPVTANPKMLAQALKARQQPRTQLTGQGLLDTAAIGLSPIPGIGDALGLAADASRFYNEPESRTPVNFGLAALGLIPFVPPLVSAGLGKFAQSQGKQLASPPTGPARNQAGAIVYHGSPHKFDQFDSSKIGTGEGAQAYGHGLYFAENPKVAEQYKAGGDKPLISNLADAKANGAPKQLIQYLEQEAAKVPQGSLYKVDLPDEAIAKMLDWDKPLSQQSKEVQKALEAKYKGINAASERYSAINGRLNELQWNGGLDSPEWVNLVSEAKGIRQKFGLAPDDTGEDLYKHLTTVGPNKSLSGDRQFAADQLKGLGIPGIRYLDGGSRDVGKGTSNYVVFPGNEGLLKILGRE
jgi:hypothetical protein